MKTRFRRKTVIKLSGILLCWLLSSVAMAVSDNNSVPEFTGDILHIPRIDVQSLGALEVDLLLTDSEAMIFSIGSLTDADPAISPTATYDGRSRTVNIPRIKMNGAFYEMRLDMQPGKKFVLSSYLLIDADAQQLYEQQCAGCHGWDGTGGSVAIPLIDCQWCSSLSELSGYIASAMPLGLADQCMGECAQSLASYIDSAFNGSISTPSESFLQSLSILGPEQSLRKATLQLLSRLPSDEELSVLNSQGEVGLRQAYRSLLDQEGAYVRLLEIFNERLLTNRYLSPNGSEAAIGLIRQHESARWFDPGKEERGDDYATNRLLANDSVATEPLQLINYVIRNELPATEILTADYMMVNGYSAKSYGIDNVVFDDEWNPLEYRPARIADLPHAGVLSSAMFLNRFPTTRTNRNRARARVVYDIFLDVDILALDGVRPDGSAVDIDNEIPTMENPECVKCHRLLDPVASAFQNWDSRGKYERPKYWYTDMFQTGFSEELLPHGENKTQLQWLGRMIAQDPRFDQAMLRILFTGLVGREPQADPGSSATAMESEAYQAEVAELEAIKADYIADKRNLKTMITGILLSPYFRAAGLDNEAFSQIHEQTGSTVLLSPERLHRKIGNLLGFEWRGSLDNYYRDRHSSWSSRLLNSRRYYQQLYGGINSNSVVKPLTEPNGLMVRVQERMANELACYAVPNEFLLEPQARRLLPYVQAYTTPISVQSRQAILQNIQHLHQYLLGETLSLNSAELEQTYQLFISVMLEGHANMRSNADFELPHSCRRYRDIDTGENLEDGRLLNDPAYAIRSWMAVVAYLLSDFRFVYE